MRCDNVLVVEDRDDLRETIVKVLRAEGFRVTGVANGIEAIRALKARTGRQLILLDMMAPLMNGWEFLRAYQKDQAARGVHDETPIVVASALSAERALKNVVETVRLYCGRPEDELPTAEPPMAEPPPAAEIPDAAIVAQGA